ncbi:MAG: dethiobiotin synthase [Flavobacteriales bacterium]|nr:dethiobiotin synthase [Flavobacteriales bacterium]|tara:strand:+ start:200 stop:814 length:615 start_codon:yes stop_codon:yes gene_type:complete
MRKLFVTGIGTDVGKTIVAAILTEALQADYWKPIQCGSLELTDTERVKRLVESKQSFFHPEAYRLRTPASPHYAAEVEGTKIHWGKLKLPETKNTLVVEGAGGIMVPFNYKGETMLDMAKSWDTEVVVVSRNYLGSINHTLLTLKILQDSGVKVLGLIFNGESNPSTEDVILKTTKVPLLGRIKEEYEFTKDLITAYSRDYIFI